MAERGHEVTVLTTALEPLPTGEEIVDGVRVVRVRARPADFDFYWSPAVFSFVRSDHWDLIHCQGYHTFVAPLAMSAALSSHQPYVVTFHSGGHSSAVRRWMRPLQQAALRPMLARAERLIGVSMFETDFFRRRLRLPREKFVTITNGVSPDFVEGNGDAPTGEAIVCSVGRLERYKGHHRVIEALPAVRQVVPEVHLRIVGDGPYRSQLEKLAKRSGVADIVEFVTVDAADRRGMADMFRAARVITLLSDHESQGVVGLEALAVGRSLVVADGTALAELGQFGEINVVPPAADSKTISGLIVRKLGESSAPKPARVPRWEHTVDALEAVYSEVLAGRAPDAAR
jgi:glycosyltransferase involved in cell wall biosynthesis